MKAGTLTCWRPIPHQGIAARSDGTDQRSRPRQVLLRLRVPLWEGHTARGRAGARPVAVYGDGADARYLFLLWAGKFRSTCEVAAISGSIITALAGTTKSGDNQGRPSSSRTNGSSSVLSGHNSGLPFLVSAASWRMRLLCLAISSLPIFSLNCGRVACSRRVSLLVISSSAAYQIDTAEEPALWPPAALSS
jgi:hypothetical protein